LAYQLFARLLGDAAASFGCGGVSAVATSVS